MDSVLVCKKHDCYCTIRKNFEHLHYFSSGLLIKRCKRQNIMVRLHENKQRQNAFKRILAMHILIQIVEYINYSIARK